MKVIVSGQHIDVGDSLRSHIQDHVEKHVSKYFENAISSSVILTMEKPHYIRTDVFVNEGTGKRVLVKSTAHDSDPYRSFDNALVKLESQMRKHKDRLKHHHRVNPDKLAFIEAKKYVISPSNDAEDHGSAPAIIAEKMTSIEELTVGDAVMKMDLMDATTYLFVNSGTKRLNVLYYRRDGNIAWIEVPPIG